MTGFWQYRATQRFFYGKKEEGAYPLIDTTLSDLNREIRAGDNTQIFINGEPIAQARQGKGEFKDLDEVQAFFAEVLFSQTAQPEREMLAREALLHFNQGGLPFASHHCVVNAQLKRNLQIKLPNEVTKINLVPIKGGVSIIADHSYPVVVVGNKKYMTPTYHAKIHSEMSFTTKGIHVQDLTIDCPNSQAAKIIDPRTIRELLQHIIDKISQLIWSTNKELISSKPAELNVDNLDEGQAVMRFSPRGAGN